MEDHEFDLPMRLSDQQRVLIVRAASRYCALPLEQVAEIMRPLPIDPLPGLPLYLRGLAVVRGAEVPVVDLGIFWGNVETAAVKRFVLCRADHRRLAIAVEAVDGLREIGRASDDFPPTSGDANAGRVSAAAVEDRHVLPLLRIADLIPEETWQELEAAAMAR